MLSWFRHLISSKPKTYVALGDDNICLVVEVTIYESGEALAKAGGRWIQLNPDGTAQYPWKWRWLSGPKPFAEVKE